MSWRLVELLEEAFHVDDPVEMKVEWIVRVVVDGWHCSSFPKCHRHLDHELQQDGMCGGQV